MKAQKNDSNVLILRGLSIVLIAFIVYSIWVLPSIISLKILFIFIDLSKISHLLLMPFVVVFEFFFVLLSEVIVTSLVINLFKLKYKEGVYDLNLKDKMFFRFTLASMLYLPINKTLELLCLTPFCQLYGKLAGAKIGENVLLVGRINDPCLTEIGDNCVIGGHSLISAHAGEKKLILKKVRIGNNCIVGGEAHIMPGVTMEEGSVLGAKSLATKNQVLEKGKIYGGVPAKEIKITKDRKL